MQRSVVYFDLHLSAAHPNAGQNMHFSGFWLDKSKKETPKHSSSDAKASGSRLKGPEFNPRLDPMRLQNILGICFFITYKQNDYTNL